jgi:putative chitinase
LPTFPGSVLHTVERGDSVAKLAERYDSTVEAIAEANGLDSNYLIRVGQSLVIPVRQPVQPTIAPSDTPSSVFVVTATPSGPVPAIGASGVYTTQPGDTLTRIARLFNTNVETLAQLNGIVNVNQIQAGQQLNLPAQPTPQPSETPTRPAQSYRVQYGDTLFRISLRFSVSVAEIAQANNITNLNRIYAGQVLIIP